jgi:flagellar motor switch protein FliN/FliY
MMNDDTMSDPSTPIPNNPLTTVPIEVIVCVGKSRPLIRDLILLGEDSVLSLDSHVEDPVELYVGDRMIAKGMLEEKEGDSQGQLAVRLTEILKLHTSL